MNGGAMYDGQPDNDQVLQDERGLPAVPVRVEGNVRTQELPARGGGYGTVTLDTEGTRVLAADPRRKTAILLALDQDIYVGDSQAEVRSTTAVPTGAYWPAGTPLPIDACDEVWISSSTGTTRLTVITNQWAL